MTITVVRSGTVITGDGRTSCPTPTSYSSIKSFSIFRTWMRIDRLSRQTSHEHRHVRATERYRPPGCLGFHRSAAARAAPVTPRVFHAVIPAPSTAGDCPPCVMTHNRLGDNAVVPHMSRLDTVSARIVTTRKTGADVDAFGILNDVLDDYRSFVQGFLNIRDPEILQKVRHEVENGLL